MELLSYPKLDKTSENRILNFLSELKIIGLTDHIKKQAIQLRRDYSLKLPDAITAATALCENAEILTNDVQLSKIPHLHCRQLKLR